MSVVEQFERLKSISTKQGLTSHHVTEVLIDLIHASIESLVQFPKQDIKSFIPNKEYFVYQSGGKVSRPINKALFSESSLESIAVFRDREWSSLTDQELQILLYTMAMSYCAAVDVVNRANVKTPSIFFERFIGNIFAREYNCEPTSSVRIDLPEFKTNLPTDYLFQPPDQFVKLHLPIKLSTRERSVQAWAHQKVLEGIHGVGTYRGIMLVQAETNYQKKTNSVVEVCLPEQWRIYQMFISRMMRVYYLDLPKKYEELPEKFPHIQVKPFARFFRESTLLINPGLM